MKAIGAMKMMLALQVTALAACVPPGGGEWEASRRSSAVDRRNPPVCRIDSEPSWNKSACDLAEKAQREREEAVRAEERRDRERRDHEDRMEALDRHTEENRKRREAADALEGRKDSLNADRLYCRNGRLGRGRHYNWCSAHIDPRTGKPRYGKIERHYGPDKAFEAAMRAMTSCVGWDRECRRRHERELGLPPLPG